jgi:hypothetical protein
MLELFYQDVFVIKNHHDGLFILILVMIKDIMNDHMICYVVVLMTISF